MNFAMLLFILVTFFSFIANASETERLSYLPCLNALNALNTFSPALDQTFKPKYIKITPLSDDGWSFAIKNVDGTFQVVVDGQGTYDLTKDPARCKGDRTSNAIAVINSLIAKSMKADKEKVYQRSVDSEVDADLGKKMKTACKDEIDANRMLPQGSPIMGYPAKSAQPATQ